MQSKCAVFRTEKTLKEGVDQIRKPFEGMKDISVKDKSLLFNTELVETLDSYASDKDYFWKVKSIIKKIRENYKH